jgi:hypothetical protein
MPCIPDMTTVGKGFKGSHDLRYWVLRGSSLWGFKPRFIWRDRSTQPPGGPPITGQYHGRLSLPVTFSSHKAGKVSLTLKSQTFGAMRPREHGPLRLSPRFLGVSHMGPFE